MHHTILAQATKDLLLPVGVHDGEACAALQVIQVHVAADVLVAAVVVNVVVPARPLALPQSRMAQAALALALDTIGCDGFHVPLGLRLGLESLQNCLGLRIGAGCQVDELFRVVGEVVEKVWVCWAGDVLPGAAADHHVRRNGSLAHVLAEDGVVGVFALEVGRHRHAIHG